MVEPSSQAHQREEGKRLKAGTGPSIEDSAAKIGGVLKFEKNPAFISQRHAIFQELYEAQQKKYEGKCVRFAYRVMSEVSM